MKKLFLLFIAVCCVSGIVQAKKQPEKNVDQSVPVAQSAKVPDASSVADVKKEQPAVPAVSGSINPNPPQAAAPEEGKDSFVAPREMVKEEPTKPINSERVVYNPKNGRDPTLSPDDYLLIEYREKQRLAAIEEERQRKLEEERRKREEAERLRLLELARIKDPAREVRNKIRIGGIIGQEVFIGSKIYTVGNKIFGARIVEVRSDTEEVVFSYKGHKFVKKVQLNP